MGETMFPMALQGDCMAKPFENLFMTKVRITYAKALSFLLMAKM